MPPRSSQCVEPPPASTSIAEDSKNAFDSAEVMLALPGPTDVQTIGIGPLCRAR
jgi:hypothetical protein